MSKMPLSGMPSAVKNASFPTETACANVPGTGGTATRNVALQHAPGLQVDGGDRQVGLVVHVGARAVARDGDAVGQVARLEADHVRRVQRELAVVEPGAQHAVAAPADDQEVVAGGVGVDGDHVVGEEARQAAFGGFGCVSALISLFRLTCRSATSERACVSKTFTSACTFTLKRTGGSGPAPMFGDEGAIAADEQRGELVREGALRIGVDHVGRRVGLVVSGQKVSLAGV
jgi:hypothetical protein